MLGNQPSSQRNAIPSQSRTPQTGKHEFFVVAQELRNMVDFEPPEFRGRRSCPRELRSISISIQPLDADFQPLGTAFWVVSRDISTKGLGVVTHDAIEHEYVRVGLLNEHVTAIGRVRHNTSIGEKYPLFLVGIEYLHPQNIPE